MHVAICDDNVADRKHLERLLSRESDKRRGTPNVLYVDSYGDQEHFLINPLKYNLIFMDMCLERGTVEAIIEALVAVGYCAPLVLYSSQIDYTQIPNLPDFVVHARKPYIPEPLPRFLKLGDENVRGYVPTVTVHQNGVPIDVPKDELEYAIAEKGKTSLHLLDNTRVDIDENITTLRQLLEPYEEFERVNKNGIANFKFVSAVMPLSVIMQSYVQLHISPLRYREFKFLKEDMDKFS